MNLDKDGKRKPVSHQVTYDKYRLRDMITPESACSRIPWILNSTTTKKNNWMTDQRIQSESPVSFINFKLHQYVISYA